MVPRRRSTTTAVPGADVKCGSMKPSLTLNLALPNSREEKWLCLFFAVPIVTWRPWNTPGSKARPKGANLIKAMQDHYDKHKEAYEEAVKDEKEE